MYGFGRNENGMLGIPPYIDVNVPTLLKDLSAPWGLATVQTVVAGGDYSFVLAGVQL